MCRGSSRGARSRGAAHRDANNCSSLDFRKKWVHSWALKQSFKTWCLLYLTVVQNFKSQLSWVWQKGRDPFKSCSVFMGIFSCPQECLKSGNLCGKVITFRQLSYSGSLVDLMGKKSQSSCQVYLCSQEEVWHIVAKIKADEWKMFFCK